MRFTLGSVLCYGVRLIPALPWHQPKVSFNWHETSFFLAFGDSYTYVQGTAGLQNYSFIGDLQNFNYTPHQLLTDEIVQSQIGTSAGGPNWVEYLTGCFSGLPSRCKTQLWDFAFAGSDVSVEYTPLHHNYTISLQNQIAQWAANAKSVLKPNLSRALVAVWIGINDISDSDKYKFPRNNATDFPSFYQEIITTEFEALETVYEAGYRNYLFMNLPPLDKTPSNQKTTTPLPSLSMVQSYNSIISSSASTFESTHPGTKAMVFDTYGYLSHILEHPAEYGIKNTTDYCPRFDAPDIATNYAAYGCDKIEEYFWYNTGHITWKIHQILAKAVGEFLKGQSC